MVKYSPAGDAFIRIDMATTAGGVEVTLTDYDVDRFDVTKAPDANINLPIEERKPGGLGLHLIRRLVDSMHYEYSKRKPAKPDHVPQDAIRAAPSGRHGEQGEENAGDRIRCGWAWWSLRDGWTPRSARPPRRSSTRSTAR